MSEHREFLQRTSLCGASALALTIGLGAAASAQTLGPLIQLTSTSIFNSCTADHPKLQPGTLYKNTEVEPNLAINPADTSNFLFGVQQDRWNNGGSRGLRGGYSLDTGATFAVTSTPGVTECQGGPWPRSSDPWVTFSPDGTAYMSALVVKESANPNNLATASGQLVSRSADGGKSWGTPITLISDFNPNVLDDKNSMTADPNNSQYVYTVWDRLTQYVSGSGVADEGSGGSMNAIMQGGGDGTDIAHRMLDHARAVAAGTATAASNSPLLVTGPTYFSRTTNGGASWELPKIIWNPGANSQTIANQIVPLKPDRIADFFTELQDNTAGQPTRIGQVRSSDHGATWSSPDYAEEQVSNKAMTPNLLKPIRSADVLFSVASDVAHNLVYLVWEDSRFSGSDEVAFAVSPDGGFQWTAPVRVNQTPRSTTNPYLQQGLIPTVAFTDNGTVVITYYDFRNDRPGASADLADFWAVSCNLRTSPDACQSNSDWSNEQRLTDNSFNFDNAPLTSSGVFLGDYMSMKTIGQTVYTVFGQATGPNLTNIYLRSLTIPGPIASR